MEQLIETKQFILYENERGDLLLKNKNIEGLLPLSGDIKFFIREVMSKID